MKGLSTLKENSIIDKIYIIRHCHVMFDSDLSELYQIETKNLNKAVKRNINRFPPRFMFQLTEEEWKNLRFQVGTSSFNYGGRRYLPYVFTEQGVAMLSAIINSSIAINVSIQIMDAFVEMRKILSISGDLFNRIDRIESKQAITDHNFEKIFKALDEKSQKMSPIQKMDFDKFTKQYDSITLKESNIFHDRFLIIDNTEIYHLGASLKDLGKKVFAFSKMNINSMVLLSKLS